VFFHPAKVFKLQKVFCSLAEQNQDVLEFFVEKDNEMLKMIWCWLDQLLRRCVIQTPLLFSSIMDECLSHQAISYFRIFFL